MTNEQEAPDHDAALADELRAHHAVMIKELDRLSAGLMAAAGSGNDPGAAKRDLEQWVTEVSFPTRQRRRRQPIERPVRCPPASC
jgi:hypothetical protein